MTYFELLSNFLIGYLVVTIHTDKIILLPKSPPAIALFVFASSVKSLVLVFAAVTTVASFGSSEIKLK